MMKLEDEGLAEYERDFCVLGGKLTKLVLRCCLMKLEDEGLEEYMKGIFVSWEAN